MDIEAKKVIEEGRAVLGIELGSTRIKSVLIDGQNRPIAQGSHQWENHLENGIWTYSIDDIWNGLQHSYADLQDNVHSLYGLTVDIRRLAAIGVSAMMHGYMAFDKKGTILVPFRTWRNTNTARAAEKLSKLFDFNIPLRWSISHLYQAILDGEEHVAHIDFMTTLAGYIHWKLTGRKVLGIGDASGMMPIDTATKGYSLPMAEKFDRLTASEGFGKKVLDIFPGILLAGEVAGHLTVEGARLLDVTGSLEPGIPFCPPEGDAGTGMVATNAVAPRTGNVSAGTSSFSMIVLEKDLSRPYEEIDIVTTPVGDPVAMVHCNNCTSDLNDWVRLFAEFQELMGLKVDIGLLYGLLYNNAMKGDPDCGSLLAYNFVSGEPVVRLAEGRPMFVRSPNDRFSLANFFRSQLYASVAVLKIGNDILFDKEKVTVDRMTGHGGLFKTKGVGQRVLAAALDSPISVMETAGEGGAWGIALLAAYMLNKTDALSLREYLDTKVFAGDKGSEIAPLPEEVEGFNAYIDTYVKGLPIESLAVEVKA
ncbi:xylulokinase [uncultured Muribaculum sp.]|uniref:xylulokinase n=1 Tax=uncultured Muribaculum sp. TaxID=1918613 RepID=UPI0025E3D9BB|nr:FGGY-family carbohydrate kinase [uncultured Muribaculum sp.]